MCGIIGDIRRTGGGGRFQERQRLLAHRGPDGSGECLLHDGAVRFGHQRLAVIDVSEKASQPMTIDGYTIIYNGEVYNFRELQKDIPGPYISESDTEVILRGYIKEGVEIFKKLNGMFALAIYDPVKKCVVCARDQFGIKPFYYYHNKDIFSFASEMRALECPRELSSDGVERFLFQGYIYGNEEILEGVYSLPPGHVGVFNLGDWSFATKPYVAYLYEPREMGEEEAHTRLDTVLGGAVNRAFISDVPVGVFLSGGIDSSLIAALAAKTQGDIETFTIGFSDPRFDESARASRFAKHLGTKHHTIMLDTDEVIREVPNVLSSLDIPLGDSSVIPTYFLNRFARERVTVALSGDGADELFGGYPLYYLPRWALWYRRLHLAPLGRLATHFMHPTYGKLGFDTKLKQFMYGARFSDPARAHIAYRALRRLGKTDEYVLEGMETLPLPEKLLRIDQQTVLPNQYLVKADRMSMAHSLEVRVPFLDADVAHFANRLPGEYKVRGMTTKYLLRKVLGDYIPSSLLSEKKEGFSFPISMWLRSELKDYMTSLLIPSVIEKIPGLSWEVVEHILREHIEGRDDCGRELWSLMSLAHFVTHTH